MACRPGFFLPVRVLSSLFRRLFLEALDQAFRAGELTFRGPLADLNEPKRFAEQLHAARGIDWASEISREHPALPLACPAGWTGCIGSSRTLARASRTSETPGSTAASISQFSSNLPQPYQKTSH